MDISAAQQLARALLNQHNLEYWQLKFDHARMRCGACHFTTQTISLSRHFVRLNNESEVRATLLHEIAHALCGPGEAHGQRWRKIAAEIGAPVQATNDRADMPGYAWLLVCRHCEQTVAKRHRRSLNLDHTRCGHCGPVHGHLMWQSAKLI